MKTPSIENCTIKCTVLCTVQLEMKTTTLDHEAEHTVLNTNITPTKIKKKLLFVKFMSNQEKLNLITKANKMKIKQNENQTKQKKAQTLTNTLYRDAVSFSFSLSLRVSFVHKFVIFI